MKFLSKENLIKLILLILILIISFNFFYYHSDPLTNFSDYLTSILLLLTIIFSILIFISDFSPLVKRVVVYIINNIPKNIPFEEQIRFYLLGLIKRDKRVVIFLPYTNKKSKEAIFLQFLGFLEHLKKDENNNLVLKIPNERDTYRAEIAFIKPNSDDIAVYFNQRMDTDINEFIIITGMSEVYKEAIYARNNLSIDKMRKIKIIGALSSISIGIEEIINYDENIIRVFPPDYDESKTAIDFFMSRIKNNICHHNQCNFHEKKSNIIVLHANAYGRAVAMRCKKNYELDMKNIYKSTNSNLNVLQLEECIKFYSFTYDIENKTFIYDFIEEDSFDDYIKRWEDENSTNYFFFVGYEPNISDMLNSLVPKIEGNLKDFGFIFSSTLSLEKWREEVCITLRKNGCKAQSYYLSTDRYDTVEEEINIEDIKNRYKECTISVISNNNEFISIPFEELFNGTHSFVYLKNNNTFKKDNFISNFAKLGIDIAREYIHTENSLLTCKQKVFKRNRLTANLLVNGDSINNFKVSFIDCKSIQKENIDEK